MQQTAALTPLVVFETLMAYQRSTALKAAIELEIFTRIGEGNKTVEALSRALVHPSAESAFCAIR